MEKFSYRLKEKTIKFDGDSPIEDYLISLGVEKTSSFLEEPDIYDEEDPRNLENIEDLVDALYEGFTNNKKFFMQIDSDVDGYTSASIFYRYFKDIYPNATIDYRVHNGKEHGVIVDTVPLETDIVIIPDAGSNQIEEQVKLTKLGKKVLIIDHHLVDNFILVKNVIVVNNQLSQKFQNKFLSGAGMVYKVIQLYSYKYGNKLNHRNYIDLAALGIISDMMDTRSLDNNYIIYNGLRSIRNPLFKALLEKQSYSISSTTLPNKIDIAFYITPLINAVVRVGSVKDNLQMFEAFVNYSDSQVFTRTYRGKYYEETLYDLVARTAYNIRNQQNKEKQKALEFLDIQIQKNALYDNSIVAVIASNEDEVEVPKTMTGLVAMDILKKYKKPALVLRPKSVDGEKFLFGSGRGNIRPGFASFKDVLNNTGLMKFAEGHDMAFGVGIKESNLDRLIRELNNTLRHIDFGTEEIEVDSIIRGKNIQPNSLFAFANYTYLYGTGIPQPKFAFEFLMDRDMVDLIGKEKTTIKFLYNGIEFIKFNAQELIKEMFQEDETEGFISVSPKLKFKIIGRAQINEFNGAKTLQIMMDNIAFEKSMAYELL